MLGLSQFQVPDYLQPMTAAQNAAANEAHARTGIEAAREQQYAQSNQQEIAERDQQMKKRAEDMLERKLTMQAIGADTITYKTKYGMDDQEASLRAMADHSKEIWKDHPESLAAGEATIYGHLKKIQAVRQAKADSLALIGQINPETGGIYTDSERIMAAYRKNIFDLNEEDKSIGSTLGAAMRGEQTADWRKASLGIQKSKEDRLKQFEADKTDLGQQRVELGYRKMELASETADLNRASHEKVAGASLDERKSEAATKRQSLALAKASKDTDLQEINDQLKSKNKELEAVMSSPRLHWLTNKKGVEDTILNLEKRRAKILKTYGLDPNDQLLSGPTTDESAAPTSDNAAQIQPKVGKRYRNADGEIKTYKGEDADGNPIWE